MILLFRFSGTSPSTIFWAIPSEIAVLPTPGSPTRIGLFFVLLLKICRTLRISSSLPITGSSLPCAALSLRLTAKRLRFSNLFSAIFSILHQLKTLLGVSPNPYEAYRYTYSRLLQGTDGYKSNYIPNASD